jgi:hypothetical protein
MLGQGLADITGDEEYDGIDGFGSPEDELVCQSSRQEACEDVEHHEIPLEDCNGCGSR